MHQEGQNLKQTLKVVTTPLISYWYCCVMYPHFPTRAARSVNDRISETSVLSIQSSLLPSHSLYEESHPVTELLLIPHGLLCGVRKAGVGTPLPR
jgi:hypothetical protein